MIWWLIFSGIGACLWLFRPRPPRLLPLGRFQKAKTVKLDGVRFYIEEVAFADYQAAIHGYFNLVPVIRQWEGLVEERYDFFDFYSVALRFEHCSVRLLRLVDRVRLVKSDRPIPLPEFEQKISAFAYGDL